MAEMASSTAAPTSGNLRRRTRMGVLRKRGDTFGVAATHQRSAYANALRWRVAAKRSAWFFVPFRLRVRYILLYVIVQQRKSHAKPPAGTGGAARSTTKVR